MKISQKGLYALQAMMVLAIGTGNSLTGAAIMFAFILGTTPVFFGLAYVAVGAAAPGTPVAVDIRGRRVPAHVVERPFYRRVR